MRALVRKAGNELIRRRVEDISALISEVYASLVDHLDAMGALRVPPFDASGCEKANLKDLSGKRIKWFLETARRERGFPLRLNTATQPLLTHLNLLEGGRPTNAAVLLFGGDPQRFHRPAVTKCIHCHGTEYQRPVASLQVYGGDLFEQADQARDFVLGKINRSIGTRAATITAPATYELPPDAVAEAIINAIVHRDYHSNASVEVRLFADRLEVWNPGTLPGTLTLDSLRTDHPSVPYNPLLAESFYLTRYIERIGSGTQTIIRLCREAGLPEPDYELRHGSFVLTLWRDWLTDEMMTRLALTEPERKAIAFIRTIGKVGNKAYQDEFGVSKATASRHLEALVRKGMLEKIGKTGKGTFYVFNKKGLTKGSKGSAE